MLQTGWSPHKFNFCSLDCKGIRAWNLNLQNIQTIHWMCAFVKLYLWIMLQQHKHRTKDQVWNQEKSYPMGKHVNLPINHWESDQTTQKDFLQLHQLATEITVDLMNKSSCWWIAHVENDFIILFSRWDHVEKYFHHA